MPQVSKQALTQFIRTNCKRQLALNLYPDNATYRADRKAHGMPYPQSPRPGLRQIQEAGDEWQAEKLDDLTQTFGAASMIGDSYMNSSGRVLYKVIQLGNVMPNVTPISYIIEGEFDIEAGGAFETGLGVQGHRTKFQLAYAGLRPDIIEVVAPGTFSRGITSDGQVKVLASGDERRQLRVIDIKLTAQPSPGYFAEVVLYSMALAGWLVDEGLDGLFVVVPDGAVWPGSHDASNLLKCQRDAESKGLQPTVGQLRDAMQEDLELVPFEVFVLRIRSFLRFDVPAALSKSWYDQDWHVDNRCSFCEYLGEDRPASLTDPQTAPHQDHCLPTAKANDHLSRVAFISQGARLMLNHQGVSDVGTLAKVPSSHSVYDTHQALRATRTVVSERAASLNSGSIGIAPMSGTSASMPKWADLRLYLSVDFDIGSAISVAFGLSGFWYEPRAFNSPISSPRKHKGFGPQALIVVDRDLNAERRELLAFLGKIHDILDWCQQQDRRTLNDPALTGLNAAKCSEYRTKVQVYVWDSLQFEHLTRVIGRHLDAILADGKVKYLAWLFPPEELLPNPDLVSRKSPITIVRDVVRAHVTAPIAHYYSLFEVARRYHHAGLPAGAASFSVHPLFGTPLSDQIPSERAHEIWGKVTQPIHWQTQMAVYIETVEKRLRALETVTRRLGHDLGDNLQQSAPIIEIRGPAYKSRVSLDGQLWYAFSRLNRALDELGIQRIRAMPPHERAARFHSARLLRRLSPQVEQIALAGMGLQPRTGRRVYKLGADSIDVKAKVGDFGFALSPESAGGLLNRKVAGVVRNTSLESKVQGLLGARYWYAGMEDLLGVTIAGLDRNQRLVVVDANSRSPKILDDLEAAGLVNLAQNAILDPVYHDFFTPKLLAALKAVGNPAVARNQPNPLVHAATGQGRSVARRSKHTPVADCLWDAGSLSGMSTGRILGPVSSKLQSHGISLNVGQWQAWEDALSHRARLIWGPPGTGKSRTIRAVVVGAVLEAVQNGNPIRVLVSAFTYTAIDNVLLDIAEDLAKMLGGSCDIFRLRSGYAEAPKGLGPIVDVELNRRSPSQSVTDLRTRLKAGIDAIVVGATPQQVHNLLTCNDDNAQAEWFDLIAIDEASQMDVAHAVLPLCGLAENGSVVLAGDPLQLAPIHQASAPKDLEGLVGSVYVFWKEVHGVQESSLEINYRSNSALVSFAREAGYASTLLSQSPNLSMELTSPLPQSSPSQWPSSLVWTPEWASLLDPSHPAVCFIYGDGRSSQSNRFEADAVASVLWLLNGRMGSQLRNEIDPAKGIAVPSTGTPYTNIEFWQKAVGVVTPHRAQQGLIVSRLLSAFKASGQLADEIRDAVDTVERFQGQQRDIIIASYTLGDPDQIAEEDEFLLSLNRFNVVASRARAKLIVLVSQEVVSHLAHDTNILRESKLLKVYAESFCNNERVVDLAYEEGGTVHTIPGWLRWRS